MALQKIFFPSSTVTATNFGALFAGTLTDGAVDGLAISYSSGNVGIATGYLVACGRLIYNNAAMSVAVTGPVAQVVLVIDASGTGTLSVEARSAASEGDLAPLNQEDINNGVDTDYELELALIDVSGSNVLRTLGKAQAKETGLNADQTRKITVSTASPAGGSDGDIWLVV